MLRMAKWNRFNNVKDKANSPISPSTNSLNCGTNNSFSANDNLSKFNADILKNSNDTVYTKRTEFEVSYFERIEPIKMLCGTAQSKKKIPSIIIEGTDYIKKTTRDNKKIERTRRNFEVKRVSETTAIHTYRFIGLRHNISPYLHKSMNECCVLTTKMQRTKNRNRDNYVFLTVSKMPFTMIFFKIITDYYESDKNEKINDDLTCGKVSI